MHQFTLDARPLYPPSYAWSSLKFLSLPPSSAIAEFSRMTSLSKEVQLVSLYTFWPYDFIFHAMGTAPRVGSGLAPSIGLHRGSTSPVT